MRRALILSTGERYVALAANFASMAALSRLLTPSEVGVAAVGLGIGGVAMTLRDFAGTAFLIQRKDLTRPAIRAGTTVTLGFAGAVAASLVLAAPFVASSYADPRLAPFLYVVAAAIVAEALGAVPSTLLRREMAFHRVAAAGIASALAGLAGAVGLAAAGFSYMSFAYGWLLAAAVGSLVALALRGEVWMLRPRFRGWRDILSFGGYNGGTIVALRIFDAVPTLLIGRMIGFDAAAVFFRGLTICQLPDRALLDGAAAVVLPAFSEIARSGRALGAAYLRALALMSGLHWPALVVVAALAYPLVAVLLGDQWRAVPPLVQILALASLPVASLHVNYPTQIAAGGIRDLFLRAIIVAPVGIAVVALAARSGVEAVAWSFCLVIPFHGLVAFLFLRRRIGVGFRDVAAATWRSALVAVATGLGPLALGLAATPRFELTIAEGTVGLGLAGVGWVAGLWATRHPLREELIRLLPSRLTRATA